MLSQHIAKLSMNLKIVLNDCLILDKRTMGNYTKDVKTYSSTYCGIFYKRNGG
jgi:hypothetical protein